MINRIYEWFFRLLPDQCEGDDCCRKGVRGNENYVEVEPGVFRILCDYCTVNHQVKPEGQGVQLENGTMLVFSEGCFDNFEGTQEELEAFMDHVVEMFESGEAFEKAEPLDDEAIEQLKDRKLETRQ
jgi:hypothetical protein